MVETFLDPLEPEDLSAWLAEPIVEDEDVARAKAVLDFAWSVVEAETGRTVSYWDEEGVPRAVRNVVLQLASRGYTNPESWGNEGVDDWRGGGRPIEELGMYLTATEKGMLAPFRERRLSGIGVVKTVRDTPQHGVGLVPTPDGPPIVWYG